MGCAVCHALGIAILGTPGISSAMVNSLNANDMWRLYLGGLFLDTLKLPQ